jgi:class 3 adenylate cyclase
METDEKSSPNSKSDSPEIDISQKLTLDDIERIEKYRQTRKTSVLAILFTDIVGFTGFTYQAGELISAKFRHIHDEIIISQVKKDGHGEIIKQIGDSFLIIFSDPTLAVKHALKLQELFRLNAENLTHKDYNLKIRIGLHMGQVSVEDHIVSDVFGTHVNIASRIMCLANGGQVLVSGSIWENASGWLKDEKETKFFSVYYGKIKLKGIDKATEIYEFYTEKTGKIGIPKLLLRKKQKGRLINALLIALLALILFTPVYFIFIRKSDINKENVANTREKIFLADIVSYDDDIKYSTEHHWADKKTLIYGPLESIESSIIKNTDENYQTLLKTSWIVDFDIVNEDELKSEFAENGRMLSRELSQDTNIVYNFYLGIIPHLYKFKGQNKYWLLIEYTGYTLKCESKVITMIDSVPIIINELTQVSHFFNPIIDTGFKPL